MFSSDENDVDDACTQVHEGGGVFSHQPSVHRASSSGMGEYGYRKPCAFFGKPHSDDRPKVDALHFFTLRWMDVGTWSEVSDCNDVAYLYCVPLHCSGVVVD